MSRCGKAARSADEAPATRRLRRNRLAKEPFATLRRTHLDHLRRLDRASRRGSGGGGGAYLRNQALAAAERTSTAARRADCVRASPALASLLASIAASSEVASAVLLGP